MDPLERGPESALGCVADLFRDSRDRIAFTESLARHLHAPAQEIIQRRGSGPGLERSRESRAGHADGPREFIDAPIMGDVAMDEIEGPADPGVGGGGDPARGGAILARDIPAQNLDQQNSASRSVTIATPICSALIS